jgi:hypothetical protein
MVRRHVADLGVASVTGARGRERRHDEGAGYPRPLLERVRDSWTSLDGTWELAIDPAGAWRSPDEVRFDRTILVPFAPETPRSGVSDGGLYRAVWYRRELATTGLDRDKDDRILLHFGAVDYAASVWVDGAFVGSHEGGYTPFTIDVTDALGHPRGTRRHTLVVQAEDDPADLAKPRGKQDWQLHPHSIWYPRTTGIWQTVWLERVPRARIGAVHWRPHLARWEIAFDAEIIATTRERLWLLVRLHVGDVVLAEDRYAVVGGEVHRRIALSDPGIDDFRNELLWSPSSPTLLEADLELWGESGRIDYAESYTALRSFVVDGGRFVLNGRPLALRMVLDQGYWPDTGLTPPNDAALRRDIELTKAMGFNGARKHQKIEDPRYLAWADRLGLLVWEEMPSAYRFTERSVERLARQWTEVVRRDASHPCIVAWVPFNESWGVPNLPDSEPERHYVEAMYHLTKTLDPTRPVIGNDGWESVATDVLGIHDYDASPHTIARRYATPELLPRILKRERPGGRALVVTSGSGAGARRDDELPVVLSEFGGIAVGAETTLESGDVGEASWGYSSAKSASDFGARYTNLLAAVRGLELLAGFCYTQLTDTYQEVNGLLRFDRTPKIPLEQIAAATSGQTNGEAREPGGATVREREGAPR